MKPRMPNRRLAALAAFALALCACGKARQAAEAATETLHVRFDDGQYAEIYRDATPEFQKTITEPAFLKMMSALTQKLGKFRSASPRSWNVNIGTAGRLITLGYASEYEKGSAVETFVWKQEGDSVRLRAFNINSPALLTN